MTGTAIHEAIEKFGKSERMVSGDGWELLRPDEDVTAVRQQHRNVFVERCRLSQVPMPSTETLDSWWPGTVAVFA